MSDAKAAPMREDVTQADREAAAMLYEWFPALSSSRDAGLKTAQFVRDGGGDGWNTVRSFRDRRLAHTARPDAHSDDIAVDLFAAKMKAKLATARAKGRHGWSDPTICPADYLRTLLNEHVGKGDPIDVANFCMMLSHRNESTARPDAGDEDVERVAKAISGHTWAEGTGTDDCGEWEDFTPHVKLIYRDAARAALAAMRAGVDRGMVEREEEDRRDAWSDFESEHLQSPNGEGWRDAAICRACRVAFDDAYAGGANVATAAAIRALSPEQPR